MKWVESSEIKKELEELLRVIDLPYIDLKKITCYKSYGSSSRSYARIWAFPKIFQTALHIPPHYVIEVLSIHFDKLNKVEQKRVLIHELLHVPKNFSGSLLPHKRNGRHLESLAHTLFKEYVRKTHTL